MGRQAARIDANQPEIVAALRRVGASVQSLAGVGMGCPDLLVCFRNTLYLIEVKDGKKRPSERKLTPWQEKWHMQWGGPVYIANSADEALAVIGLG